MSLRHSFLAPVIVTALAGAAVLTSVVCGQQTRPADAPASGVAKLAIAVWSCSEHGQLRMPNKGACPVCGKDLVRQELVVQGGDQRGDPYPLETCPVSGRRLGEMGSPIVMTHEGREVRFCSQSCISRFQADAPGYLEKIDRKIVEQQLPHYPLTTCPVSKQPLGAMGKPVDRVYNNRLVRFCCRGCVRIFKRSPAEYVVEVDKAILASERETYPLKTCVISGMKLGSMGEPIEYIVANRLVRFCSGGCVAGFFKDPATSLGKLEKARKSARGDDAQ